MEAIIEGITLGFRQKIDRYPATVIKNISRPVTLHTVFNRIKNNKKKARATNADMHLRFFMMLSTLYLFAKYPSMKDGK